MSENVLGRWRACLPLLLLSGALVAACSNTLTSPTPSTSTTLDPSLLNGQVLLAGTATGVGSAVVTLTSASGVPQTTTTNASGNFGFTGLSAGNYTIQASAPGFLVSVAVVTLPVSNYVINLAPAGSVSGTSSIAITGLSTLTAAGQTSQLSAIITLTDGSKQDITSVVKWTSSVPNVATVSSAGVLTAFTSGSTVIAAVFQDITGSVIVSSSIPGR